MISEWEQWAVANAAIKQHGDGAADFAVERAQVLQAVGDEPGAATWEAVLLKIGELQRSPGAGEALQ